MNKNFWGQVLLAAVAIIAAVLISNALRGDSWIGFYYPDADNLIVHRQSPELKSLDDCREWVNTQIRPRDNYDYECGRNCKMEGELYVCEETIR